MGGCLSCTGPSGNLSPAGLGRRVAWGNLLCKAELSANGGEGEVGGSETVTLQP